MLPLELCLVHCCCHLESWSAWILHACIITYPWNPWCNDPLTFGFRCLVPSLHWCSVASPASHESIVRGKVGRAGCTSFSFLSFLHAGKVLVVSWGLTLFVSTLYGDLFGEWDSSVSTLSSASSLTEGSKAGETPSMEGGRRSEREWT